MSGSIFGKLFRISTWGESHGRGIGVVIDGCPAGLSLTEDDIQRYLDRRKPGQSAFTTGRKETDQVEILSGVFEGRTTGTPISLMVYNKDQRSRDYSDIAGIYRPGHGDYTWDQKYGFRDYRGGGRSSGRETLARVAGGAVAAKVLSELGIEVFAYTRSIGPVESDSEQAERTFRDQNPLYMTDEKAFHQAEAYLQEVIKEGDSAGGIVECIINGMPAGIGEPVFDKLPAVLGQAILSIGAVKGFEIGDGFAAARSRGSLNNDSFTSRAGRVAKTSNHAGGTLGGISDGDPIIFRAAFKPTPSISLPQETVNRDGERQTIRIAGRHDPLIVPRAVVVVECMAALAVLDQLLMNMSSRLENIKTFYK